MEEQRLKIICPQNIEDLFSKDLFVLKTPAYTLMAFDDRTINFLNTISKSILSNSQINRMPEIVALGFWLRKSNLEKLKSENEHLIQNKKFLVSPIGKVLHICPANVDTMFFYSLTVSILMGNKNILRISNRMEATQVFVLFDIINTILLEQEFAEFKNYINIISYPHNDDISNYLSSNVNARVIWGGDQTINIFKSFTTSPRTKDIVFADRVSMMFIDCDAFNQLQSNEVVDFMHKFYNDAYTFDQMGCSSPQTIYFIGDPLSFQSCTERFISYAEEYLKNYYNTDISSIASLKMNRIVDDVLSSTITKQIGNNLIKFLFLSENVNESQLHGCGGGYFYIMNIADIKIIETLHNAKVQTLTYWGLNANQFAELKSLSIGEGIDRIVPLGEALNFNYIWDGYNLFDELSRKVFIK
jgi:hypothetical protein